MRVSSILKVAAAFGVLLLIGLIGAAKALHSAAYQAFLADKVRVATGLDLSFTGPTKIKLGLSPQVSFTGLTLAQGKGGPPLLYVDRIEAKVALLPLVMRVIEVERLSLQRPVLRLSPMTRPRALPDVSEGAEGAEGAPPTLFALHGVQIEDGRVLWRDSVDGAEHSLDVAKVLIRPESPAGGALGVRAEGAGGSFALDGVAGSLSALVSAKPYPLQFKGSINGAVVVVRGQLAEPLAGRGMDLDLHAQGDELADLLRRLNLVRTGHAMFPIGPYKVSGRLTDGGLSDLDAVFGRRDNLLVGLKGSIGRLLPGPSRLDLAVNVEADSLADLGRLLGVALPGGGPLKLGGHLADAEGGWRLSGVKAQLGHGDFAGELSLAWGARPRISGRLSSTMLALGDFSLPPLPEEGDGSQPARPFIPVHDDRIIPLDPLPLGRLRGLDLSVALAAARLSVGSVQLADAAAGLSVTAGKAVVDGFEARMGDGTLKGEARLDASGRLATATLRLAAVGIDLSRLGVEGLSGQADLGLDFKAAGAGFRGMAASLDGNVAIGLSGISLERSSADTLPSRVAAALAPGGEGSLQLPCAQLRLPVKAGMVMADPRVIVLDFGRAVASAAGTLDLRSETLDVALAAKGAGWVRLKGILAAPELSTDGPAVRLASDPPVCRAVPKRH